MICKVAIRAELPVFVPDGATVIIPVCWFSVRLKPLPLMLDVHPLPLTYTVLESVWEYVQDNKSGDTLKTAAGARWYKYNAPPPPLPALTYNPPSIIDPVLALNGVIATVLPDVPLEGLTAK